mmetsp:Transcript_60703/g.169700  ORF Transcript_60703/g.169700 Transcript_60703/m.169700 type:complete len:83 (+) Transcript_60703:751-999(+)
MGLAPRRHHQQALLANQQNVRARLEAMEVASSEVEAGVAAVAACPEAAPAAASLERLHPRAARRATVTGPKHVGTPLQRGAS